MQSWTKIRVLLALGVAAVAADTASAQMFPYHAPYSHDVGFSHDYLGSWGGHPYAGRRSADTSRRMAADRKAALQTRALQQHDATRQGVRSTLSRQSQSRSQAIRNDQASAKDWWFQQQQRQLAGRNSRPQHRTAPVGPRPASRPGAAVTPGASGGQVSLEIIPWPPLLRDPRFAQQRVRVETPYRQKASQGDPTPDDFREMIDAAAKMKGILQGMVNDVTAADYLNTQKFLDALTAEAQSKMKAVSPPADASPQPTPAEEDREDLLDA